MTIKDLIDKYNKLAKTDEMINLNQVISDLKQIQVRAVRKFIIKGDK
jgi:hypothetical protein